MLQISFLDCMWPLKRGVQVCVMCFACQWCCFPRLCACHALHMEGCARYINKSPPPLYNITTAAHYPTLPRNPHPYCTPIWLDRGAVTVATNCVYIITMLCTIHIFLQLQYLADYTIYAKTAVLLNGEIAHKPSANLSCFTLLTRSCS